MCVISCGVSTIPGIESSESGMRDGLNESQIPGIVPAPARIQPIPEILRYTMGFRAFWVNSDSHPLKKADTDAEIEQIGDMGDFRKFGNRVASGRTNFQRRK